ncbi:MAG TPA: SDR family NAD(P)-dependent oxidoreductase [Arachnia sp.]|nr:SDR family NAD(P)-dependent oxidoreductase [Arachnia sp.]HMT85101.1 SDR family NAD(P)-dependent oxidoreductase [Arachnia sp.]
MSESHPIAASTVVVVSGGSRGLGLEIVRSILANGAKVATFARTVTPELEQLAAEHPDDVFVAAVDATDDAAVRAFLKNTERALGPIDGLVNNAAIGQDSLHVHTSAERIEQIIRTNLVAPLVLTRAVLRRMLAGVGTGRVVNITSVCGQRGYSGLVAYSSTKAGMDGAMRALAREMHGRVLVNSIAPGFFASEMSSVLGPNQLDTITRRTPTGRLVEPENIVPVLELLLFSDTNINGQSLVIDGGGSI